MISTVTVHQTVHIYSNSALTSDCANKIPVTNCDILFFTHTKPLQSPTTSLSFKFRIITSRSVHHRLLPFLPLLKYIKNHDHISLMSSHPQRNQQGNPTPSIIHCIKTQFHSHTATTYSNPKLYRLRPSPLCMWISFLRQQVHRIKQTRS